MDTKQTQELSKLIAAARMPNDEIAVQNLWEKMDKIDLDVLRAAKDEFGLLCDSWQGSVTESDDKANICVRLAELSIVDSESFRGVLNGAIHHLLPPYLATTETVVKSLMKTIGAKDENVSVHDAAMRLRKLQHLRSTALVYQFESHQWFKIHGIDSVMGNIAIAALGSGSVSSVPITSALFTLHFFNTTPEIMDMLYPGKTAYRPSADYRRVFRECSLSELYDQKLRDIIQRIMVPDILSVSDFEEWWKNESCGTAPKTNARPFWESRSVLELYTLLGLGGKKEKAAKKGSGENNAKKEDEIPQVTISEEAAGKLKQLFERLRRDMQPKEVAMLAECVSVLSSANTPEVLTVMFTPLRGKASFWPAKISAETPLLPLEPWGQLSVKLLGGFVKATAMLYTPEEIALLGTILPQKCITPVFSALSEDIQNATIIAQKVLSCDMILWIFKNRSALPKKIYDSIDMARVIAAISLEGLPKEWGAAQRDLKKAIFDKEDFQKFLIENADGDIPSIIGGLQRYRKYQPGERQSILVKLSRHSSELKDFLESPEGKKLMGTSRKQVEQIPLTSIASQKRMADELQDLITVQIPENAAAVALARSYGDLRENAEFDAAKERRRFLHSRRSELEHKLNSIQPTDFKNVEVKNHVVVGCVVTLAAVADGKETEYYLLGAWDGDPDKHYVAYTTEIGKALMNQEVGTQVELPNAGAYTIKAVKPLPEDLRKALACEA